jgi:hypothetical protein
VSDDKAIVLRDDAGKLLPGTASNNPEGRPVGTKNRLVSIKRKLEIAVREGMSADRLGRIISKMADMAEDGDVKAARLILDKFISSAGGDDEVADKLPQGITIKIENATFAKLQQSSPPVNVIDVTPIEIK